MKQKLLLKTMLLLCALIVGGVSSTWADEWNYTFNASSGISKGPNTINEQDWEIDHDSGYENNEATGYHVGSSSKTVSYLQLSTSGIPGKITKIVVNAKGNGSGGTISASVGGSAYAAKDNNTSIINTAQDFEFTGFSSGEIIICLQYSSLQKKNFYVSSITVTYEIPVTGVSLASTLSVQEGSTETLTATVSPNNATIKDITWSSEDESIATVSSTGVVTGVAAGTTTIWATSDYDNTKKASCTVTVTAASDTRTAVNLTGFSADKTTLVVGETTNTTVTNDQNGWTAAYTYESDDTDVATVDANGVITAVAKGSATITCSLNVNPSDANYKAGLTNSMTVDITVTKPFHTATFSVNGNTSRTASVEEGELITFPTNIPDENGKKFMGWYTGAYNSATTAPTYVNTATTSMGNSDVTYYAVFADVTTTYSETETETQTLQYDTWTYYGTTTNKSSNSYRLFAEDAYIESASFDLSTLKEVDVYAGTFGNLDNDQKKVSVVAGQTTWGTATLSTNSQSTKNEITSSVSLSGNGQLHIVAGGGDGSNTGIRISQVDIITKKATTTYANYSTSVVPTHTLTYSATNGSIAGEDGNSAAVANGASVAEGATVTLTATPSSGYEFSNWSVSGTGASLSSTSTNPTTFTMGTSNATVTANFEVAHATALEVKTAPTKLNYKVGETLDLTGLVLDATVGGNHVDVTTGYTAVPANGATLNSVRAQTVTFTYDGQTTTQIIHVGELTGIEITTAPTKTTYYVGQTFDPTGMVVTATFSDGEESPTVWTEDVTAACTFDPDTDTALETYDNNIDVSYIWGGVTKTVYQAITVNTVYTVTYAANGGTGTMTDSNSPYVAGAEVTLLSNTFEAPSGKIWDSWSVKYAGNNDVTVTNGKFTMPASNVTVTAQWADLPCYTVTLSDDTENPMTEYSPGVGVTLPTRSAIGSYAFAGWSATDVSSETTTAPTIIQAGTYYPTANITLYPVYTRTEGSGTTTEWHLTALSDADEGVYALLTPDYHAFNGTVNSSGHGEVTSGENSAFVFDNNNVATTVPSGICEITFTGVDVNNVTVGYTMYNSSNGYLYASDAKAGSLAWHNSEDCYWYYDSNSGNWVYSKEYSSKYAYLRTYSNTTFRTYATSSNDELKLAKKVTVQNSSTYYWSAPVVTYSVTYDGNGNTSGSVPTDATAYSPNATVTVLGNTGGLAKTGYTFGGWNTQDDGEGTNYAADETFSITANTTLYAKWINVTPTISLSSYSVEATCAETNGSLTVTCENIDTEGGVEIVWYTDNTASSTTTEPDWIDTEVNTTTLNYEIAANTGAARTAYFKVYGLDEGGDDVYSELVTVSQAIASTTYSYASSITSGKHYVIAATTSNTTKAMGGKNASKAYYDAIVDGVSLNGSTLSVAANLGVREFIIYCAAIIKKNNEDVAVYSIYDPVAGGYLYASSSSSNDLNYQTTNDANGLWEIDFENGTATAQGSNSRNVLSYNSSNPRFSCYGSKQTAINFYEKDGEATPTVDITFGAKGYASYCSPHALNLDLSEKDYAAWAVTDVSGTAVTFTKITTSVPAGTPFILYGGMSKASETVSIPVATGETTAVSNNMLIGTLVPTVVYQVDGDYTNFGLSMSNGDFRLMKTEGSNVPANKAYLHVLTSKLPSNPSARMIIVFNDETTGISSMQNVERIMLNEIYDLQGRRVETPRKGSLYIVNGKKVVY